jgi:DmsE family decaheme c-type cytochrome
MKRFLTFCAVILVCLSIWPFESEAAGDYAGIETCLECHEESHESFLKNRHAVKGDPRTPGARQGCESCHGPGAAHAEEEDPEKILSLGMKSALSAEKKNAICLGCHTRGKLARWHGSEHDVRGLSCADCHSIHGGLAKSRSTPTELGVCTQCHKRIRADLLRQSHHPIREGKIKCMDCHNPHGAIADRLVDAQYINLKCYECHADTRGPFLWQHPPALEDCLSCHRPHGSTHDSLLKAKTPYLCQRCHSNTGHGGELYARRANQAEEPVYRVLNNRVFYRNCLNCHVTIHGSNHPSGRTLLR